ncbi:MAG: membrane-spanning protein [SAR86 cluster bacterium SAR86A]|jgi:Co/Zn/Cd efflux system component|uniref:Membrane-spanning protein n=1 Tax=SAR86 cluster bacterium SAR86A TaxID=1123866 RepID=J5K9I3_9GAMM|nr:MAG: membrane-spanning protein [SAR86 cluster bacterium SAR86A]|tara:strand:+ start:1027 stop:2871 length:1845 start_codon:yes stop_codon:yes gene_type:complete
MITLLNKNKLFLYCLVVIISSSFFASLIQTSFGKVDVKLMNLKTPDGQNLVYDLYKPSIATENDKQPFIVVVPGFQRSKEALSNIAIELSRRGYVVALIDPYAQGMSSSSLSRLAATTQGYGMFALVDYAYAENFSFIDINKIGSTGHSMGGNAAIRGADYFGKEAIRSGKKSKLDSVYISGYVLTLRENILRDSKSNMGVSYALYDEGAFRNDLQGWDAGNMKIAPESLRTVNSVLPKDKKVTEVELGKYYGERSNNTLRVIFNEELLHPFQPYNKEATKNQLDYFDKVFGAPISINSNNQIWQYKELFTLINMIVSLLMLIPIAKLFLSLNFYKDIVKDIPASLPEQTSKSKMIFWSVFFLSALIACISFIPMVDVAKILFYESANRELTWFFPQRMNNSVMLWAAFNGSIGLVIFFLSYYFFGRHHGVNTNSWGLQINKVEFFKTIMLGLSIFICYYLILYFVYFLFHVDYRFWFMGVRIFQPEMLLVLVMYFPLFFIFFFSNSLRVNGAMRFKNQSEWKSRLIAGFANSLGLMMIIIIQYVTFAWTGTVFWTTNWLSVNLLFGIVPMMFILPYFNRIFFQLTGRVYLGPIVTCLIFIMILSTNTVVYLPL